MGINLIDFNPIPGITPIQFELENGQKKNIDVLRLDKIDEIITGNKWYKLKYNLLQAQAQHATSIVSFGGPYSNHLHALAYAGKLFGLKTIAYVRGEEVENPTLKDCKDWGMELHFINRERYRNKLDENFLTEISIKHPSCYIIPEGGDNELGQKGSGEILSEENRLKYQIIICSVGTGTTLRGLASVFSNKIIAYSALKDASYLEDSWHGLGDNAIFLFSDKYFGGFGKKTIQLVEFIQRFKAGYEIELDWLYTGKMCFQLWKDWPSDLIQDDDRVLLIHSGGLQGNRSLIGYN